MHSRLDLEQILQRKFYLQRVAVENIVNVKLRPPFHGHQYRHLGQEYCWAEDCHVPNDKMSMMLKFWSTFLANLAFDISPVQCQKSGLSF